MAAKVKQSLLKNYEINCEEAEEQGLLECFKLPKPFMITLSLLSTSKCLLVLRNFPLGDSKETSAENIILLYGLTDAVIHSFLHPGQHTMFTSSNSHQEEVFWKIGRYIEKHWVTVLKDLSKKEYSESGAYQLKSLLKLLKDCSTRLEGRIDESHNMIPTIVKFGEKQLSRFVSKSSSLKENETQNCSKQIKCTCIMCPSSPPMSSEKDKTLESCKQDCTCVMCLPSRSTPMKETQVKVGSIKVRNIAELTASAEKKLQKEKQDVMRVPSPQTKVLKNPMKPVKSACDFVSPSAMTEPIYISDSPMKSNLANAFNVTPEKKSPLKISTKTNENPSAKKTVLNTVKAVPAAKRPLFPEPNMQVAQKKQRPGTDVLSNGKINAFAFMMQAAAKKKMNKK